MIPKKLSEVLRVTSPRKMVGTSYTSSNRFSALQPDNRSNSKKRNSRSRSNSHRRNSAQNSGNNQAEAAPEPTSEKEVAYVAIDSDMLERCKNELSGIAQICEKIDTSLIQCEGEQTPLLEVLGGITIALRSFGKIHAAMLDAAKSPPPTYAKAAKNGNKQPANPQKAATSNPNQGGQKQSHTSAAQKNHGPPHPSAQRPNGGVTLAEQDKKYYRFRDVIKDAEKSTLVFGLNLGRYPIMDTETMSTRASLSLSAMAAAVEKQQTNHPSDEARETLDDVMGCVKKIEFYGRQTRSYRNPRDKNSGAYCTLPVRYDFSDRDLRIRAEKILRERCDINCSTPYPLVVRECMKKTAAAAKAAFPEHSVRINIDAHNFCLRIGVRAANERIFSWIPKPVPLPALALEVDLKKLPRDFNFDVEISIPGQSAEPQNIEEPLLTPSAINANPPAIVEPAPMEGTDPPPK